MIAAGEVSCKWMFGLALLGMTGDMLVAHPALEVKNEYQYKRLIPRHTIHGFASERQWLFAHRKFQNQCVLEAVAADERKSREQIQSASFQTNESAPRVIQATNNY